ncbi:hypothetical protein [Polaribacter sp. R77954]|uniref:hypothetical protein n=1 Tax=Polaribacter sp. R77954 TaxID=3093870 RepID=UPI0037C857E8
MELTRQQIKYIDHRLENEGIKYWDIRIELLDHVVSYVEQKLKPENSEYEFKEFVQESFESLGWRENFNGDAFEKVFLKRNVLNAKKIRKKYGQEIKSKFTSIFFLLEVFLLWVFLFLIHKNSFFIKLTFTLEIIAVVLFLIFFVVKYQLFKSSQLNAVFSFAVIPVSVHNLLIFAPQILFDYEKMNLTHAAVTLALIFPFLYIGFNFMLKEAKSSQKIYNKLME